MLYLLFLKKKLFENVSGCFFNEKMLSTAYLYSRKCDVWKKKCVTYRSVLLNKKYSYFDYKERFIFVAQDYDTMLWKKVATITSYVVCCGYP